jgi:hypothetical protein
MHAKGLSSAELEDTLYWDSLTFDAVKQWRAIHFPITLAFAVLALGHIVSIFLCGGWSGTDAGFSSSSRSILSGSLL